MKLSEYLAENGISQKFFATKLGYTPQYINKIVTGKIKPPRLFIQVVNKYLAAKEKEPINIEWDSP